MNIQKLSRLQSRKELLRRSSVDLHERRLETKDELHAARDRVDYERRSGGDTPYPDSVERVVELERELELLAAQEEDISVELKPLTAVVGSCERYLRDRGIDPDSRLSEVEREEIRRNVHADWDRRPRVRTERPPSYIHTSTRS